MSKHTPGPWMVSRYSQSTVLKSIYIRGGNERIARIAVPDTAQSIEEYEANAKLIAAAPELLTWLQLAVKILGNMPAISETWQVEQMRDVISKAKGDKND